MDLSKRNAHLRTTVFVKSREHLLVADHVTGGSGVCIGNTGCGRKSPCLEPLASPNEDSLIDYNK